MAAQRLDTITLFRIPLVIGKVPSFVTALKFLIRLLFGKAEKPFCS